MPFLRKATSTTLTIGPFVDETDGFTPETALTISQADVRLSKGGFAFGQKNEVSSASHMENGFYEVAIDDTDTDTQGPLTLVVAEAGARIVRHEYDVICEAAYDSLMNHTGNGLKADVMNINTDAIGADEIAADALTEIADAVLDEIVEGTTTLRQSIRLANGALAGKASGMATTTAIFRDLADTKDRITATVDEDGNRTALTRDVT